MTYTYHSLGLGEPVILGAFTYILLSWGLRNVFAKDQARGMQLVKQQKFTEAIFFFEKSVTFFSNNTWIDKFRFLTILSMSKMTYKEMGLCNIAFCYSQTGNGVKAKEYYERTLAEFPENGLAKAGLNMITSFS